MKRLFLIAASILLLFLLASCSSGYTEEDLEQAREEAYEEAYEEGYSEGHSEGYLEASYNAQKAVESDIDDMFPEHASENAQLIERYFDEPGEYTDAEALDALYAIEGFIDKISTYKYLY